MPKSCSAYNCTNRYNSKNPELTFHRFPLSKPHLLQEWLENIGRADFCPKRHMVICSQHFTPESFSSYGNRKNLTWNAVPTLFNATQGQPKVRRYGKLLKQLKNDPDPSPVTPTTPVAPAGEESRQCSRCQGVEPVKGEQDRSQPPHTQVQIRSQAGPEPASTHTGTDQESSRTRASLHTPRYRSGVKQDRSQPPHTQVQIRSQAGPEPASTHTHRYRSGVKQDQSQPPHTQVQIRSQAGPEPASTHTHRYRSGVKQDRSQPPHTQVQIRSQAGPEPASTHTGTDQESSRTRASLHTHRYRSQAGPEPASTHTGTDQESSRTRASLHTHRYRSGVKQDRGQPPHTQHPPEPVSREHSYALSDLRVMKARFFGAVESNAKLRKRLKVKVEIIRRTKLKLQAANRELERLRAANRSTAGADPV
ncbi:peroxynitrite isomerase THAP4-like isoform X1 [Acipenser ruthenus]|uniref:peroxynitrite isomerase THAP4-like isoform X1 n=2 Tax=Acipenser ruthenus TaxID=7906 RepID=UPI002740A014|nr:peroxynitrite isomerase THAP4-like isoform X1 [Acipenser ruthenus]